MPNTIPGFDLLTRQAIDIDLGNVTSVQNNGLDFLVSAGHFGTLIPDEAATHRRFDDLVVIDTDLYTDQIYALDGNCTIIQANSNPFFVNENRPRDSIEGEDAARGVMPTEFLGGAFNLQGDRPDYSFEQKERFLQQFYDPYHDAIRDAIDQMKQDRGYALLLDGHSMSSEALGPDDHPEYERPIFLVGTDNEKTADKRLIDTFVAALEEKAREFHFENFGIPKLVEKATECYAGGFTTRTYGNPAEDVHTIQLEINKGIYVKEALTVDTVAANSFGPRASVIVALRAIVSYAMAQTATKAQEIYGR